MDRAAQRSDEEVASPTEDRLVSSGRVWLLLAAAMTAFKLWLVSAQTLYAYSPSPGDDEIFLHHADEILRGRWLGRFSEMTLVKGPVYSMWLALVHLSGARLLMAQAVLYVVAAAVLSRSFQPAIPDRWRRAVIYCAVLFNPVTWADGPATRVTREGIYSSLTILLLGLAIGAALRLRASPRSAALWGAAAGLTGGLFAMTREEGPWLAPSLAIILLAGAFLARRRGWRTILATIGATAIAYAVPTTIVASLNWKCYGLFELNEVRAGYYTSAFAAFQRVKTSSPRPYVPVPREARAALYKASPAFREVGDLLEEDTPNWAEHGCKTIGVCDDIAGGWFEWAVRRAARRAGKYRDGAVARAWYQQVTREVDDACRSGRLECSSPRSPFMPRSLGPLTASFSRAAVYAATLEGVTPHPGLPQGNPEDLLKFEGITDERIPRPLVRMEGVVASRAGEVQASVLDPQLDPAVAEIRRFSSSRAGGTGDEHESRTRFSVVTSCVVDCRLALFSADRRAILVPLSETGKTEGDPALTWTTDSFQRLAAPDRGDQSRARRLTVLAALTRALSVALPVLFTFSLAVLLWRLFRAARERSLPVVTLIAVALLAGIAARLLVVAVVDVTAFPAITVMYLSPMYGLLVAFTALVLVSGRGSARASALGASVDVADAARPG